MYSYAPDDSFGKKYRCQISKPRDIHYKDNFVLCACDTIKTKHTNLVFVWLCRRMHVQWALPVLEMKQKLRKKYAYDCNVLYKVTYSRQ